jgi:hypothetical protein
MQSTIVASTMIAACSKKEDKKEVKRFFTWLAACISSLTKCREYYSSSLNNDCSLQQEEGRQEGSLSWPGTTIQTPLENAQIEKGDSKPRNPTIVLAHVASSFFHTLLQSKTLQHLLPQLLY